MRAVEEAQMSKTGSFFVTGHERTLIQSSQEDRKSIRGRVCRAGRVFLPQKQ